jgi:hypothetical protein
MSASFTVEDDDGAEVETLVRLCSSSARPARGAVPTSRPALTATAEDFATIPTSPRTTTGR